MGFDRGVPNDRPMAGHRMLTSLTLVAFSVAPATVGTLFIWTWLRWEVNAYGALLLLLAAILGCASPYALGWTRSLVILLVSLTTLRSIQEWLDDQLVWAVLLSIVALTAICLLAKLSLRWGKIRRPKDAKLPGERDNTWPYQYY